MPIKQDPYRRLVALLTKGDRKAFERIYNDFWESLFVVGYNRIGKIEIVEDILQEIFCDLWRKRNQLNIAVSLHTYLHAALKYKVIDYYRSAKFQYESSGYSIEDYRAENDLEQVVSFNELYSKLVEGIEALPKKCKLVFKMSQVDAKKNKEIAEELGISERTVETQLYKSRKILRRQLSDYLSVTILVSLL